MRYHYIWVRMAKMKNTDPTVCAKDVDEVELSYTTGGNVE